MWVSPGSQLAEVGLPVSRNAASVHSDPFALASRSARNRYMLCRCSWFKNLIAFDCFKFNCCRSVVSESVARTPLTRRTIRWTTTRMQRCRQQTRQGRSIPWRRRGKGMAFGSIATTSLSSNRKASVRSASDSCLCRKGITGAFHNLLAVLRQAVPRVTVALRNLMAVKLQLSSLIRRYMYPSNSGMICSIN